MKSRQEIAWRVHQILQETAKACPQYADRLHAMRIKVSGRMTRCAGYASYKTNTIKISLPFYADDDNFANDLANTTTHEAAHLLAYQLHICKGQKIRPHGREWRSIHRAMGGNGERCHKLKVAAGFQRRRKYYETTCCQRDYRAYQKYTNRFCYDCGEKLEYELVGTFLV